MGVGVFQYYQLLAKFLGFSQKATPESQYGDIGSSAFFTKKTWGLMWGHVCGPSYKQELYLIIFPEIALA